MHSDEITMRIRKETITTPTKVRCENEREQGYHHYVQFPVQPAITTNQTRLSKNAKKKSRFN